MWYGACPNQRSRLSLNKQENKQETLNKWRGELTKGRNVQLPAVHVYSQRGARGVRGAVFRDIVRLQTKYLL